MASSLLRSDCGRLEVSVGDLTTLKGGTHCAMQFHIIKISIIEIRIQRCKNVHTEIIIFDILNKLKHMKKHATHLASSR